VKLLAGRWVSSRGNVHVICSRYVRWQSGSCTPLAKRTVAVVGEGQHNDVATKYVTEMRGTIVEAVVRTGGQLEWSDGDIWERDLRPTETPMKVALRSATVSVSESLQSGVQIANSIGETVFPSEIFTSVMAVADAINRTMLPIDTSAGVTKAVDAHAPPSPNSSVRVTVAPVSPKPKLKPRSDPLFGQTLPSQTGQEDLRYRNLLTYDERSFATHGAEVEAITPKEFEVHPSPRSPVNLLEPLCLPREMDTTESGSQSPASHRHHPRLSSRSHSRSASPKVRSSSVTLESPLLLPRETDTTESGSQSPASHRHRPRPSSRSCSRSASLKVRSNSFSMEHMKHQTA